MYLLQFWGNCQVDFFLAMRKSFYLTILGGEKIYEIGHVREGVKDCTGQRGVGISLQPGILEQGSSLGFLGLLI